jgi:phosphoribosyl-dephospho-CoA transferase
MFARHELIWLTPAAWSAQLAGLPDAASVSTAVPAGAARDALLRWRDNDWPLIVRRSEPDAPDDIVCAGLAAPPDAATGARLRIPLRVDASHIVRHERPLPLLAVVHAAPSAWQSAFATLADLAAGYDMRVYGSFALQALTGLPYLRASSDIDIAFYPQDAAQLDAGVTLLATHAAQLPLDGEIIFPSGQAVSWKEWHATRDSSARVLVKAASAVHLRTPDALRAELEPA